MQINNGGTAQVRIPGFVTGTVGRQGQQLAFVWHASWKGEIDALVDGKPARLAIAPGPSFKPRQLSGLLIATIIG